MLLALVFSCLLLVESHPVSRSPTILRVSALEWLSDYSDANRTADWTEDGTVRGRYTLSIPVNYLLAVRVFNDRDTSIVPDLGRMKTCPFNLSFARVCNDAGNPFRAVQQVYEMVVQDNVDAMVGFSSVETMRSAQLAQVAAQIPVISNWCQGDEISNRLQYPNVFRTWPADRMFVKATVDLLNQFNFKRAMILHLGSDSGPALALDTVKAASELGIIISTSEFDNDDLASIEFAVRKVVQSEINVVICLTYTYRLALIAHETEKQGLNAKNQLWIFSYLDRNPNPTDIAENPSLRNLLHGSLRLNNVPSTELYNNYVSRWMDFDYEKDVAPFFPPYGTKSSPTQCSNWDFDALLSPDFMAETYAFAHDFQPWPESFDAMMALGFAICEDLNATEIPRGAKLVEALGRISFSGLSGRVRFDENGDRFASSIIFGLFNWQTFDNNSLQIVPVATWSADESAFVFKDINSLRFRGGDGMGNLPVAIVIPIEDRGYLGSLVILGYGELAFVNFCVIFAMIWLRVHWKTPIVNRSQPEPLTIVVIGTWISSFALLFIGVDDEPGLIQISPDMACNAAPVIFSIGLQLSLLAMILKTLRISLLFNARDLRRKYVSIGFFLRTLFGLLLLECILIVAWTIVAPLTWVRTVTIRDANGFPLSSAGRCIMSRTCIGFFSTIYSLHAVELIILAWIANRTKQLPAEFSEAKYIALTLFSLTQMYLLAVPLTVAVYSTTVGRYVVLSSIIFVSSIMILGFMIYPKMYFIATGNELFSFSEIECETSRPSNGAHAVAAHVSAGGDVLRRRHTGSSLNNMPQVAAHNNGSFKDERTSGGGSHHVSGTTPPPPNLQARIWSLSSFEAAVIPT